MFMGVFTMSLHCMNGVLIRKNAHRKIKGRALHMMNHPKYAKIDDYLDLYLFAAKLNDHEWQKEIKNNLAAFLKESSERDRQRESDLRVQLTYVNRRILGLYQQLRQRNVQLTEGITNELYALKQRRMELEAEIEKLREQNRRIS
jgi:hypothetical protein